MRFGHRRTLAAIEAELPTVPVYVIGDEATSTPVEIERLLGQYAENEHRAPLTSADRVNVVHQLSLLKVSPTQFAKRTRMARADVDHAVAVAKSATARDLARSRTSAQEDEDQDEPELTLEHLAAIAEFDDDPVAVDRLIKASQRYGFAHTLAGLRDERQRAEERAVEVAELEKRGLRVVFPDQSSEAGRLVETLDLQLSSNSTSRSRRLSVPISQMAEVRTRGVSNASPSCSSLPMTCCRRGQSRVCADASRCRATSRRSKRCTTRSSRANPR